MSTAAWLKSPRARLDITAGLVDGILNALTLAAGRLLQAGAQGATPGLALRVGAASAMTTVFVFFVAHYAEQRAELVRAEQQLSLLSHGRLAASQLGRKALIEALLSALTAAACGLVGSMAPLLLCSWLPGPRWLGLSLTLALLGVLGALMAESFHGSPLRWAGVVVLGGAGLT